MSKDERSLGRIAASYRAPKHWPVWLGIGLLRVIALLPVPVIHALGSGLGSLAYALVKSRRRVARINIRQAFPAYTDEQIEQLNRTSFKSLGMSILEFGIAWFKPHRTLQKQCRIEGREYLEAALNAGNGVILLTGHFTTLEIGARLIAMYVDAFNGVYKRAHNPCFDAIMLHYRTQYGYQLIENTNVRAIVRGIKNGRATWFAPDQDFADQEIVFTPFLGGTASTLTATAKLAKMTGAAVVPFYPVRLPAGGYLLKVLPALENFPDDDIEVASARVNRAIEAMVYDCPEQYLWSHKRFKTQPDRKTNIYAPCPFVR
jgi:KDO2-lipid IV(A) lauroyltransferase